MLPIYLPLLMAALVAAVVGTLLYHQAAQNRIDRECVLAVTRSRRKQDLRAQERRQQVALDLAA